MFGCDLEAQATAKAAGDHGEGERHGQHPAGEFTQQRCPTASVKPADAQKHRSPERNKQGEDGADADLNRRDPE